MSDDKISIGKKGESIAKDYLIKNSYRILEYNYRNLFGEIDIISLKDGSYYFVEVKTRRNINKGYPFEAVNNKKIARIKKLISIYCLKNRIKNAKLTILIVSVILKDKPIVNLYEIDD